MSQDGPEWMNGRMNRLCEPVVAFLIAAPIIRAVWSCLMNIILDKVIILQENIDSCEMGDVHIACLAITVKGQICTQQEF